jgi:hypothetical protein
MQRPSAHRPILLHLRPENQYSLPAGGKYRLPRAGENDHPRQVVFQHQRIRSEEFLDSTNFLKLLRMDCHPEYCCSTECSLSFSKVSPNCTWSLSTRNVTVTFRPSSMVYDKLFCGLTAVYVPVKSNDVEPSFTDMRNMNRPPTRMSFSARRHSQSSDAWFHLTMFSGFVKNSQTALTGA